MRRKKFSTPICVVLCVHAACVAALGQTIEVRKVVDKWVTVTGTAAGVDEKAAEQAVAHALRTAVEQACGVFLTAQSKTRDYKAVYDKVFANTVGYVIEHKLLRTWTEGQTTRVRLRARVSTQKFEKNWAVIAHTVHQENNPRVVVAIAEAVRYTPTGWTYEAKEKGAVQTKIEDFFITKGLTLMDHATARDVSKRDVLLAAVRDDTEAVAALGARFKADVVVMGRATAKFGKTISIADQRMHQYIATLNLRVVQTDSARILASKSYGPITASTLQRGGGEDKALAKLADESAPKILAAVVEAWRKRANIQRTVQLMISGMDYAGWKAFKTEAGKLRGVTALHLREITENLASIDVQYQFTNENLADHLIEMKKTRLKVTEITANRIKLKIVKQAVSAPAGN